MVYGIAKMLNFAHGDVIMVGAYVILTCITRGGMSPVLAVILSVVVCTVLGVVIEKVAYSPLRKASSNLAVLITAIGVSYLLQNLALLIFGADAKSFVSVVKVPSVSLFGGQLMIKGITIVTILACIVIMVGLSFFVKKMQRLLGGPGPGPFFPPGSQPAQKRAPKIFGARFASGPRTRPFFTFNGSDTSRRSIPYKRRW